MSHAEYEEYILKKYGNEQQIDQLLNSKNKNRQLVQKTKEIIDRQM